MNIGIANTDGNKDLHFVGLGRHLIRFYINWDL